MPTPSFTRNMRKWSGVYFGATRGRAVPHNSRRACLCKDADVYSRECCEGALINQSIGETISTRSIGGAFSLGFSTGFDVVKQQ